MIESKINSEPDNGLMIFHELVLLAFDDRTGRPQSEMSPLAVSAGILAELAFANRIKIAPKNDCLVHLIDSSETDCGILNRSLKTIGSAGEPKSMSFWIRNLFDSTDLMPLVAEELCRRGILERKDGLLMWTFTIDTYPEANPKPEQSIKARLSSFLFEGETDVDERTALLAGLANVANLLEHNFGVLKVAKHQQSIDELLASIAIGERTKDVITAIRREQDQIRTSLILMSAIC